MMKMNLQFFAHKKGVGSTKNGRDSESKRLGAKPRIAYCSELTSPFIVLAFPYALGNDRVGDC